MIVFPGIPKHAYIQAYEREQARAYGRTIRLSIEDTDETISAWLDWYRSTPWPIDWKVIRFALIDRAHGCSWRPS